MLEDYRAEMADLQARLERAEAAFSAACAFIDSHVADPDITAEMVTRYAEFNQHRAALAAKEG